MSSSQPIPVRAARQLLATAFSILILIGGNIVPAQAGRQGVSPARPALADSQASMPVGRSVVPDVPATALKWIQRPDRIRGTNILSLPFEDTLSVADDWLCLAGSPVADLHFWGSYLGWEVESPRPGGPPPGVEGFRIQIYSDVPATSPDSFSHPGKLLYQVDVKAFHESFVASIPLAGQPEPRFEHKYRYDLDLPRIFWQQRDRIYWLNIAALPKDAAFPWGWESSMDRWNDYAVEGWYRSQDNWNWQVIQHPLTRQPVDMSFALSACQGASKWLQFPDMAQGVNILSDPGQVVADDWLCRDGRPITEVQFWGSYLSLDGKEHWQQHNPGPPLAPLPPPPAMAAYRLSIHADVPAGTDRRYSHPGELLYEQELPGEAVEVRYWDSIPHPDVTGEIWWEHKFLYHLPLKEPFPQEEGQIYWLDAAAYPAEGVNWFWGWETSQQHWNDNAVRGGDGRWNELGGPAHTGFEDLPVGSVYPVGNSFVTMGMTLEVQPFQWADGTWYSGGDATVVTGGHAGGSGREMSFNNINLGLAPPLPLSRLSLRYGDYGGNVNLRINGSSGFRNVGDLVDLDGQLIEGVAISVSTAPAAGGVQGSLKLTGPITDFAIGGQEFFVDDIEVDAPVDMAFLLVTQDDTDYCEGDFDRDGDVDGTDLAVFSAEFGRTDCFDSGGCMGDFDYDGDVDGTDLALFSADFGRVNCSCKLGAAAP